ncbi:progranulin isoform X2 [Tiliqua scincoides]|uniref:progranulin isoform X2 n=1 Tax=Tiliqua scincoides TaxID=71010 RepID=UPI0034622297
MWAQVMVCLVLGGTALSLQCPDGRKCEEPFICCRLPGENGYSCCDQPQFTEVSLRMLTPNSLDEVPGTGCPDGSTCPVEYSCLRTPDASFACCPWDEGVSCADGLHCCPKGSHCSADGHSCFQSQVGAVQCPDHESECPNESTCCLMRDGSWGCCPMPEASCCPDKIHCCPHATTCDLEHTRCLTASGEQQPLQRKFPAWKRALVLDPAALSEKISCLDDPSACPGTATCCQLLAGQYGCCPLQNAVCCSDHFHCCPQGTTCDMENSKCALTPHWLLPMTSLSVDLHTVHNVQCDAQYQCPEGNTCCQQPSGTWGCCPLVEAVCCSDGIHCCPKDYQCNLEQGTCLKDSQNIPWVAKTSSVVVSPGMPSSPLAPVLATLERDVKCDDRTSCSYGQTCCRLASGQWGCCPFAQAVCCADHEHCCPSGYTCDVAHSTCSKSAYFSPWISVAPVLATVERDVKCDDLVSCPDIATCCQLPSEQWGCCYYPQAVCCADHEHCCPSGYTCDLVHSICTKSTHLSPWISVVPVLATLERDVKCDDRTSCPDGQTCCRLASGQWGCCPFAQAVCCLDHIHCCPSGYQCAPEKGSCVKSGDSVPWLEKTLAIPNRISLNGDVKCDDRTACLDGTTCCRKATGEWGCCPIPEAICCADHKHCCPSGYTCDVAHSACTKSTHLSPWISVAPVLATLERDVKCDDRTSCPDGTTCCRLASGQWGCCPFAQAVCCSDHIHCCPQGYTCNQGSCQKSQQSVPWATKRPASSLQSQAIRCNDTASCQEGQTCCKSVTGDWACCQLPNAVCCDDHQHCCPSGYTCNTAAQTCEKRLQPRPSVIRSVYSVPLLSSRMPTLNRDVQCDLQHYCHDHQTCCQTKTGGWACCPFNKGTCCSDKRHCCPLGFRCSRSGLDCNRNGPLRWDTQPFFTRSTEAQPLL